MSPVAPMPEVTDDQRRNAVRLGLILGGACLALTTAFFILFTHFGLPKDPKVWKRMQQRESAAAPLPPVEKEPAR